MFARVLLVIALSISQITILAQELSTKQTTENERESKNAFGVFFGNTVVYQTNIHLPTVGVEYAREIKINRKNPDKKPIRFGLGLIVEEEIGYEVYSQDKTQSGAKPAYERNSALLISPALFINVYKGLIVTLGYGVEYEHVENFKEQLFKLGVEYKLEMKKPGFYILPSLSWDHTNYYDGVVYGMIFSFDF